MNTRHPSITSLSLYPTKGAQGVQVTSLAITPQLGITGDRQYAYAKRESQPEKWTDRCLYAAVNTAPLVSLPASQTSPHTVQNLLNLSTPPKLLNGHNQFNFAYNAGPTVSLLNLATLRLFETFLHRKGKLAEGARLNPERFRMNILMDNWPAFAELGLADGSFLTIGKLHFRVREACIRCKAIHANPATGRFDFSGVPLLTSFMNEHLPDYRPYTGVKKAVMGLILTPLDAGELTLGNTLSLT